MINGFRCFGAVAVVALSTACDLVHSDSAGTLNRVGTAGVFPVTSVNTEYVNLSCTIRGYVSGSHFDTSKCKLDDDSHIGIVTALAEFDAKFASDTAGAKAARNSIQGAIIGAVDRRCLVYKTSLQQAQTGSNVALGSVTTILGGIAGIVTQATPARILGASAGITSGINAEIQSGMFRGQTASFVVSGINQKMLEISRDMAEGRAKEIDKYPVIFAINDAIRYNGACSLSEGFDKAQDILRNGGKVGLEEALAVLRANRGLQDPTVNLQRDRRTIERMVKDLPLDSIIAVVRQAHPEWDNATLTREADRIKRGLLVDILSSDPADWQTVRARLKEYTLAK